MSGLEFDTSEVRKLVRDLEKVSVKSLPVVRAVVQKGALNIKTDWRQRWSGHPHAPALPASITYDTKITAGGTSAEIGPDKSIGSGPLGNIYEFGTPRSAPIPAGGPALATEEPKFIAALEVALAKLMEG